MKTQIMAEQKAELIAKVKQYFLSEQKTLRAKGLDHDELFKIHGHDMLSFLYTDDTYYLDPTGELQKLTYRGERHIEDGRVILLYTNRNGNNINRLITPGEDDILFQDEANLNYYSSSSEIFGVINENEKTLAISAAAASEDNGKIYIIDKEDKATRSFKKVFKSTNLTYSESIINFIDKDSGEIKEVFKIFSEIEDQKEKFYTTIMGVKKQKLSTSIGYRTGFKMTNVTLMGETDEDYTLAIRMEQKPSGAHKTGIFTVNKDGSEMKVQKDNGRASIIHITDEEGNESFSLYNTTSQRVNTKETDKNTKFEVYDTNQYRLAKRNTGGAVTSGYTVDAKEGLIKPDVLETAELVSGNGRWGRNNGETTITLIVKDHSLYFREHPLYTGYSWGDSFDVKEVTERKVIDLSPGQEEFLMTYFKKHKKDELLSIYMSDRCGSDPLSSYVKDKIIWDKSEEKLYFLKDLNIEGIDQLLAGDTPWFLRYVWENEDKRKPFERYLQDAKSGATSYIFDIKDEGFKTEKKFVLPKNMYNNPKEQLKYMKEHSQEILREESMINQLV